MRVVAWFHSEAHRAYFYRVLVALSPVLIVAGVATGDQVGAVLSFAGIALGTNVLPALNTSTKAKG